MSNLPNDSVERRRKQAQDRRRKRVDLNRHYLEEEAVRALEAGSLKLQRILLTHWADRYLADIFVWLGSDEETVLNNAICFASMTLRSGDIKLDYLKDKFHIDIMKKHPKTALIYNIRPTPDTIRALLRSGDEDAGSLYAMAGLELLHEGLIHGRNKRLSILVGSAKPGRRT